MPGPRLNWTEAQLLQVLSLYQQLPFGQMDQNNAAVRRLAELLGRTPGSVALKLVNFASFDPTLQSRGIKGMRNASRLDRQVWNEYHGRWSDLARVLPESVGSEVEDTAQRQRITEMRATRNVRIGQQFFRNAVMATYERRCCITGIGETSLLRAGHIVPWATSANSRLDPANGLCLNALHDAAFESGLMTIDEQYRVVIARGISQSMSNETAKRFFRHFEGEAIFLPQRNRPKQDYLQHHRENKFVG